MTGESKFNGLFAGLCSQSKNTLIPCFFAAVLAIQAQTSTAVSNFGGNPQHTANYQPTAQDLNVIRWSTSVDLHNTGAATHYGAPLISAAGTVFVPVKTSANSFEVSAFNGSTGAQIYTLSTDYLLPSYNWIPSYGPALATSSSGTRLYYPGAGGTVYYIDNPDVAPRGAPVQLAFYGLANYQASRSGFNSSVFIDTPITSDSNGNIFFGFRVQGKAPAPLATTQSGFARIDASGKAAYVLAGTAAGDTIIGRDSHNSAPALSNDESTLYVLVKASTTDSYAYLLGLDSTTLATKYKALLLDPRNGTYATVTDDSTASPMAAPDGDVYIGVLGNSDSGYRGFLLRFSHDLSVTKTPGAFGWDYTPAVVPSAIVPSYTGSSSYLILSKYNNYPVAGEGDGVNRIALLDPNATQIDPHPSANGLTEMREVLTLIGVTPDTDQLSAGYPMAVSEWCVNTPAVNPATKSIFVPSEDGHIYRWDLSANSLSQAVRLSPGIGEQYVPVAIGPDGTVYTLNGGNLFAVGSRSGVGISVSASAQDLGRIVAGQPLTFTAAVTNTATPGLTPTGSVTFQAVSFQGSVPVTNTLAANVPLDATGHASITTSSLTPGGNFITASYSGNAQLTAANSTMIEMIHASATATTLNSSNRGQAVTLTAAVVPAPSGSGTPTGMVTFEDGGTVLAQIPLSAGTASFSTSALAAGNHAFTARYASDTVFAASSRNLNLSVAAPNSPPAASNVTIAGTPYVGQILTGHYDYSDRDGDPQGVSTFRWLRDGSSINGANTLTYTPTAADLSHAIVFEVMPVAATGASPGVAVRSAAVVIANSSVFASLSAGGLLSGAANYATNPANLTTEGNADWIHWGGNSTNHKATGGSQLSAFTVFGNSGIWAYINDPRLLSWTDGTPTGVGTNDPSGVYLPNAVGNGFSFSAPADTAMRTLVVHAGGYFSAGTLTAHLSDASATDFVDTTTPSTILYDRNYVLTYRAASAGQTLIVTWVETTNLGAGNVNLSAAALSMFSGAITPTAGNPETAAVGNVFTTPLKVTVTDANNNPVSGATVTFTAPSGGATATFNGASTVTAVTGVNGIAVAPTLTANSLAGSYYVVASVAGIPAAAFFALTNAAGAPVAVTPLSGTPESAVVNTPYTTPLRALVTDAANNPIGGATVTFKSPSNGPSALFNGATTVSAVTDASGIVFAPALLANGQPGSYVITASAAPGVTAAFSLTNTAGGNGTLTGSGNSSTSAVNLTAVGTSDWIHWADSTLNRKATGGSQISTFAYAFTLNTNAQPQASVKSAGERAYLRSSSKAGTERPHNMGVENGSDIRLMSWSDGSPTTVSTNNGDTFYLDYGTYVSSGRSGYTITAPADTTPRTLTVYVGGNDTGGTLMAHLSDGSAPDFVDTTPLVSGSYDRNYTLTYSAGAPGQSLTVTWVMNSSLGNGNVILSAAALSRQSLGGGSLSGSSNSASSTFNLTTEGTVDWVHWGDSVLNRKSGVTSQISSYTVVGSGPVMSYTNDPRALSWTDGAPTASGLNNNGVYINSLQNGFSFTAPADTSTRVLNVHAGGWLSGGTLTAYLSDGSAPAFIDSTTPSGGQYDRNYSLSYSAASAGQTLIVSWVASSGAGNVTLNGAALSVAGPSIAAAMGTPQSAVAGNAFATALQAMVKDANNNPVSGATVTFTAPGNGASAAFSGSATASAITNTSGIATAPTLTANSQPGTYTVLATTTGASNSAGFSLTNLNAVGSPASVAAIAGTPQSTIVGNAFTTALQATVKDANNNPLSGVTVTFTAPGNGASAVFGGSTTATATTNSSGIATAPTLTANGQAGNYMVTASVAGVPTVANFALANTPGPPASVTATAGTPQSTTVSSAFASAMQATVKDVNNIPLSGVTVTFSAPVTGAGASFNGSATATATTNASGIATAPSLTANGQAGSYTVIAAVAGVSPSASFSLTNTAAVSSSGVSFVQRAAGANAGNNQNTLTVTLGSAPSSSNVLVLMFNQVSAAQTITSITGATWTKLAQNYSGNIGDSEIWAGVNPTSSTITITGTNYFGIFQPGYAIVAEFSGIGTTLDGSTLNTTGGVWPVTTGSLNTSNPGDLLLTSALSYNGGGVSASVSSPWTLLAAPGGTYSLAAAYQIVNATGSYTATWNGAGNPQVSTLVLALKAAGAQGSVSATAGTPQSTTVNMAFLTALQASVTDGGGHPISGATVTFRAPSGGAAATFAGSSNATAMTNGSGVATAPPLTANGQAGSYAVTATVAGISNAANFALTNRPGPPAAVIATAGTPQSAVVNNAFSSALQATVKDANNNVLSGVTVTFSSPVTGAGAVFSGSATATATTNASGIATAPTLTANSQAGSYAITASVTGVPTAASFALSNTSVPPPSITAGAGTPQSATVKTAFATALQAVVKDFNNNPVSGVTVTFTAPGSGASGAFTGSATATAMTNASGVATAPTLTANSQTGSYAVTASAAGVSGSASFALTNTAAVSSSGVSLIQQAAGLNGGNNQNTLTVTLASAPSSSNVLILIFNQVSALQTITSITGATWTRLAQNYASNNGDSEIWVGTSPTSAGITITGVNYFGIFQPGYAIVAEFSGISTTLDGPALNTTGGFWPVTTSSLSTGNAGDLLLTSALSYNGGGVNASVRSPWTLLTAPGGTFSLAAAYQIVNATGSYSAIWNGNGSPQVSTIILALKAGSN